MFFEEKDDAIYNSSKSDEEILSLSVDNPSTFEVLVDRYQQAFFRKAVKVVGNREDAEDIVQDTFVKIYRNADKFQVQQGASFSSWGYKILLNTSFTHYQKMKKRGSEFVDIASEFYDVIPDLDSESIEKKEVKDSIFRVFSKMPKNMSNVLQLHFIEGRSHKEIADREGTSVGAIKARAHKAKKEFKKFSQ